MKKRLLSMLTLICILTSLFAMPITVHAATPTLYITAGAYPGNTTLSWTNVGAKCYDLYWLKYDTSGRYLGEFHVVNTTSTSYTFQVTPGYQQFFVNAYYSDYNCPKSNTVSTTIGYQNYYLDVNGLLDGSQSGNLSGYGTVDVYINGSRVANDVTDYYTAHPYGSTYQITDIQSTTGHRYKGVNSGSTSGTIYGATNVRLSYGTNSYTITVASESTTKGTVSGGGTYVYGKTATIKATPKTGYSFSKWDDGNTSKERTVTVSGDKTYTAYFTANKYTISVSSANTDMGTVSGGGSIAYGTSTTITATPKPGYSFSKWSDGNTSASRTITVSGDASYKAEFVANNYTLYVRPRGGTWNGSTGNQSYPLAYQGTKSIPNPTKTGYTFAAWGIDFSGSGHKITGSGSSGLLQVRGTPLFSDPVFSNSNGGFAIYNNASNGNASNGNVTHKRVAKDSSFEMSSGYMMQITTSGTASPGLGGFVQSTYSKLGGTFYHIIAAKIPVGYNINFASNLGSKGTHTWLTPNTGTGKWETYIYKTTTNVDNVTFGHVYITGTAATSSKPVTWYVGYAEMFDATNVSSTGSTYTMGSGAGYLQALWVPNRYTVKYNSNADGVTGTMSNSTHIYDTAKTLTANAFVRDGYEFLGWSTDSSSSAVAKYTDKQSVTNLSSTSGATVNLYAVWKKIPETSGVEFSETSYHGGKKLTLVSGTSGAKIYYTTDGSTPTTSSKVYSEPLDFNTAGTFVVKAFAYRENYITSAVTTSEPVVVGITDDKYAELVVKNEPVGKSIALTTPSDTIKVYYTEDGSDPSTNSLCYSNPILYPDVCDKIVNTMAVAEGCVPSSIMTTKVKVEKVATPNIEIFEDYPGGATIKISCSTSSPDVIYYSVYGLRTGNGSVDPLGEYGMIIENGRTFEISEDSQIRAVAKKAGYAMSDEGKLEPNIQEMVLERPEVLLDGVFGGYNVTLHCGTEEEVPESEKEFIEIIYTLDGSEPKLGTYSTYIYTEPFILDESDVTLKAIAIHTGYELQSDIYEETITIPKMASPKIMINEDTDYFDGYTRVKISYEPGTPNSSNATIYYTTDGTYPTTSSTKYNGRFNVTESCTVMAIAMRKGYLNSELAEFPVDVFYVEKPSVATLGVEDVTERTATLRGQISNDGGGEIAYSKFYYYEEQNGTAIYEAEADSDFKAVVTNLKPNTEYTFYAKAANEKGSAHGELVTFRTTAQISENPTKVSLSKDYISMKKGTKTAVLATVLPENATNRALVWKSDNPSIASVDKYGNITANAIGKTTITAIAPGNGLKDSVDIAVVGGTISGEMDFSELSMARNLSYNYNSNREETFFAETIVPLPNEDSGGTPVMATAYLARWGGVVLEENDPYIIISEGVNSLIGKEQNESDYHVQEVLFLPQRQHSLDNDDIKKAIMEYGAVYSSFCCDKNYFKTAVDKTTGETIEYQKNFYMSKNEWSEGCGHAIAIVGWDDDYQKKNFRFKPEGDGAFICKNSWGTEDAISKIGEDGYFYISYYDPYLARFDINAVFNNIEVNTNYNKIYQYDPLGPVMGLEYDNQVYMANVFPKLGEVLEQDETLEAVSFYTADKGVAYEIYVIPEYSSENFFEDIGECKARGIMEYAGYHTVELDDAVELKAGNRFAVIVKLSSRTGKVSTYVEAPLQSSYASFATADDNESFMSIDGVNWNDIHLEPIPGLEMQYSNTNVCVKAFTNCVSNGISLMSAIDNDVYDEKREYSGISAQEALENGFIINPKFIEELEKQQNSISLFEDDENIGNGMGSISSSILVGNNGIDNAEGAKFPPKYDLREQGFVSSVKDQGEFSTCWAFATYASLESCLMKKSQDVYYGDNLSGSSGNISGESLIGSLGVKLPVTNVFLNKSKVKIAIGNEETLYATIAPTTAIDKGIVWSSDDTEIVQVDTSGTIRAIDVGVATITATNQSSGLSASCVVTVTEPAAVTGITSDITKIVCNEGDSFMIDYEITPENAGNKAVEITFADDIATVSGGLITATKSGETTITITTVDGGHSITIPLTVLASETDDTTEEVLIEYAEITDTGIAADIVNENDNDVIGEIFIATYDKDTKKMIKVISEEITVPAGDILPYSTDIEIASNHAVKIFIWKKQNLKPLCEAYELN